MTDDLMALADAVSETPARRDPEARSLSFPAVATTGGPVEPDSEGGRAGGAEVAPGAVSGFVLPDTRVLLRFDEGRDRLVGGVRPTLPPDGPPPNPRPTGPVNPPPHPPPLGVGPLYDALPRRSR